MPFTQGGLGFEKIGPDESLPITIALAERLGPLPGDTAMVEYARWTVEQVLWVSMTMTRIDGEADPIHGLPIKTTYRARELTDHAFPLDAVKRKVFERLRERLGWPENECSMRMADVKREGEPWPELQRLSGPPPSILAEPEAGG